MIATCAAAPFARRARPMLRRPRLFSGVPMLLRRGSFALVVVTALLTLPTTRALADTCFELPDTRDGNARSSARKITLGARVQTKASCEYALSPDAAWIKLGALDSDFASIVDGLVTQTRTTMRERPTSVFARTLTPRGATQAQVESIFLAGCSEYLLGEGQGFSLRVPITTQRPTVTRESDVTACGAQQVALFFIALPSAEDAPLLRRGPFTASLATDAREIVLDAGAYAIYAARNPDSVGYLLGRVDTGSSLTPLREALRAAERDAPQPWLRAAWKHGRIQLEPLSEAQRRADAWTELRTAATTDAVWLQRRGKQGAASTKLGKLAMSEEGDAIYLPVAEIAARMVERYGDSGRYMAPDLSEWRDVTEALEVCVADRYALPQAAIATALPAQCIAMTKLMAPLSIHGGVDIGAGRVCIQDTQQVMTAAGATQGTPLPETCAQLQQATQTLAGATHEVIDAPALLLANLGARLRFEGQGVAQLFACLDNDCQPLPGDAQTTPLTRSGLLEIRHADSRDHARSAQALTRLRVVVIDPVREWHPVGLHTAKAAGSSPWHTLLHDADQVFTYTRRKQHLDFRFSGSPTAISAWNQRAAASTQLTQNLPIFGGVTGALEGTKHPALVMLVTESGTCADKPASEQAQNPPLDPEQALPDQAFYVHLAQYIDDATPLRCLARARFRVVPARSLRATDQIRVGLLGDAQLLVFISRPAAIGMSLPLVYGFWRWGYGFGLDGSISLASAVTFDPSQVNRTGLMASTSLVWGPERIAPRLLSFGVGLHAATGTHEDNPWGSVFAGLNLSSLFDLAGGR